MRRRIPEKPGYVIVAAEPGAGGEGPEVRPQPAVLPIADRLQTASADQGAASRQVRGLPHLREGRPNKVGPNLWGVVGATRPCRGFRLFRRDARKGEQG